MLNHNVRPDDISVLASSSESETLEFKATSGTRREAAMTVCVFLNQNGGQVLFGVAGEWVQNVAGGPGRGR